MAKTLMEKLTKTMDYQMLDVNFKEEEEIIDEFEDIFRQFDAE